MTDRRDDRYPGYDVLSKRAGMSWDAVTRGVIDRRLDVSREPRFLGQQEFRTLAAICRRIVPQPVLRPEVPLAAYVDGKLADNVLDGYRQADLPPQREAWRLGLAGFEGDARGTYGRDFPDISYEQQDLLLKAAQAGELSGGGWGEMPSRSFFEQRVLPDIVGAYYAHPTAWSEIGFGGPASPRGYVRMGLDRRDPWEAAEAKPDDHGRARRENDRVR